MLHPRQLTAARALAGWSQEELAAAAGVGLVTLQGLEGGFRDTRYSSVLAIVEALRRRGIEFTQGSERYVGGVAVVRGSTSDWVVDGPEGHGGKQPMLGGEADATIRHDNNETLSGSEAEDVRTESHSGQRGRKPAR